MPRVFYFVEGHTGSSMPLAIVKRLGLDYAFETDPKCYGGAVGPGGKDGAIIGVDDGTPIRLDLKNQTWTKISESVWFGFNTESKPGPEDFLRKKTWVEGYPVVLADGNRWTIPIIRLRPYTGPDQINLPMIIGYDDGKPGMIIKEEFQELYYGAEALRENLLIENEEMADIERILSICNTSLKVNYRISDKEIVALKLIDTENIKEIVDALLDGPNLRQLIEELNSKKNEECEHGATSIAG